jgi:hypothetical protein
MTGKIEEKIRDLRTYSDIALATLEKKDKSVVFPDSTH